MIENVVKFNSVRCKPLYAILKAKSQIRDKEIDPDRNLFMFACALYYCFLRFSHVRQQISSKKNCQCRKIHFFSFALVPTVSFA